MSTITLPETPQVLADNGDPLFEVIRGQRVALPPMSSYSTWLASRLQTRLGGYVDANALGNVLTECLLIFDPDEDTRKRPDLAFISTHTLPLDQPLPTVGDWEVVPDVIAEFVSPNDLFEAVVTKIEAYFSYGVKQAWLVIPALEQIYVYDSPNQIRVLTTADHLDGGELIPGFRLSVAELFKKPV